MTDVPATILRGTPQINPSLVTIAEPLGTAAEAIRALRTHVVAQHIHAGRRALTICGPSLGLGCTFVATNLAVAMAQAGLETLLIDADLRNPSVDKLLPPTRDTGGLRACLASPGSSVSEYVDDHVFPNLSVLYAGARAPNAQELLAQDWFELVMNTCMREYEVTIIDTPPANSCADARLASTVAGYSLIVARRNKSLVSDIRILIDQLRGDHAKVIGTVLNDA